MKTAKRVQGIKASVGFELLKLAKVLKAQGDDVVSLAIGELKWNSYPPLRSAGKKAIDEGWTKYSPSAGREPLRQKLSERASQEFGFPLSAENIFIGNGCKYVLFSAFQSLCEAEDEVLLPSPYWMSYPPLIQLSGAKITILPTNEKQGFKITSEDLKKSLSPKTKVLLLNSPNNPTGAIYSKKEWESIGEAVRAFPHLTVMVDAIYDRIVYSGRPAPHLLSVCPDLKDQVLAFNGASKNYLMTGWRLGWLIGPKGFVQTLSAFQSQSAGCANTIAQKAFEDGFALCEEDIKSTVQKLKSLRDNLIQGLSGIPGLKIFPPEGAFYLWIGVQNFLGKRHKGQLLNSSQDIMKQLLSEKKLLCISGEEFGCPGYLRLSYAGDEEDIKKAISRFKSFFSELT